MAIERVVLTYEDYLAMPDDGLRHEILDGELVASATPVTLHQLVLGNLYDVVRGHVRARGLGAVFFAPLTVILADTTVVEPDLVYIEAGRTALIGPRGVQGAPTLLVEVLSPSTASVDRGRKFRLYARLGGALLLDRGHRRPGDRGVRGGGWRVSTRRPGRRTHADRPAAVCRSRDRPRLALADVKRPRA